MGSDKPCSDQDTPGAAVDHVGRMPPSEPGQPVAGLESAVWAAGLAAFPSGHFCSIRSTARLGFRADVSESL